LIKKNTNNTALKIEQAQYLKSVHHKDECADQQMMRLAAYTEENMIQKRMPCCPSTTTKL